MGSLTMRSEFGTRSVNPETGQVYIYAGYVNGRSIHKLESRLIAEKVLRKSLPKKAVIHHFDENASNNEQSNLVICQGKRYHELLHQRTRAKKESGHADWRKCNHCKTYDQPENLYISPRGRDAFHRECRAQYCRETRAAKRAALRMAA
jgi:hypothetical protein